MLSEVEKDGSELISAVAAIRLLIFTGARKSEILTLRWEDVDFERGYIHLTDSKTGAKDIPLTAPTLKILSSLPHLEGNPYVLHGEKPGGHLVGLHRAWDRIRKMAGLDGVRLHDLRHSFASVGVASNIGLPIVGKLLGHKQTATTDRYIHFDDDPLKRAADQISTEIAAAIEGNNGNVIPIKR